MPNKQSWNKIKDYLKMQFNLPSEQIEEMLPDFINTLEEHLVNLEAVLHTGDVKELGKVGHTIKGALINLGLHDCAEIAYSIEKRGKAGDQTTDYEGLVAALRMKLGNYLN